MPIHDELIQHIEEDSYTKESLNFIGKEITDEYVVKLAQALKKNSYIKKLDLSCKNIGDKAVIALASVPNLEELDISESIDFQGNKREVTIEAIKALSNSNLKILNLSYIQLNDEEIGILSKNTTIINLKINSSYTFSSKSIADFIATNNCVEILDIGDNGIGDQALITIHLNNKLKELDISQNGITDLGAKHLSKNKSLLTLNLTYNSIENEGASMIAYHPTLTTLYLGNNKIGNKGIEAFVQNNKLKELRINDNMITSEAIINLSKNTTISSLWIGNNEIDGICTNYLCSMNSLEEIHLFGTAFTENDLKFIQKNFAGIKESKAFYPLYDFTRKKSIKDETISEKNIDYFQNNQFIRRSH